MNIQKIGKHIRNYTPTIYAFVFFLILLSVSIYYTTLKKVEWEKDVRANLLEVLIGKKSKLEKALSSRIYYTKGVAAFASTHPDMTNDEFYDLARQLIKNDSIISTMSISKNGVINAIYPLEGHEAAIGLNLMAHPKRKEIVEKTIKTEKTFIAGPVELIEGGIAFISYTPIFDVVTQNAPVFWGMTDIVIYKDKLIKESSLSALEGGFNFALKGYDGLGENGAIFWGDESVFKNNPGTIEIDLPDGKWILAATPEKGWSHYLNQDQTLNYILFFSSLIISILFWLLIKTQLKVRSNEKELKAIFNSMHNLIIEFSKQGEYLKIAPTNEKLLFKQEKDLIGRKVHEIFDQEMADLFLTAIRECINKKELVTIEYLLKINQESKWFSARISYKSESSVIFNAHDITDKKKDEENIRESEKRLKQLNEIKDKFFSIIAHDLRNPVGSLQSISELLLSEFNSYGDEEKKELLAAMQVASVNLTDLLENLLAWAQTQKETLSLTLRQNDLSDLANRVVETLSANSKIKNIQIKNHIVEDCCAICDQNATMSIMRNLISNAIKFTHENGEISLECKTIMNGREFRQISISDNGIGISPERLASINNFDLSTNKTTQGTKNEIGSGLGLILCKEFTERQGGHISVESSEGAGTTVSFTLPAK